MITIPLGVGFAIGIDRWRGRASNGLNLVMIFSFVVPELLLAVALMFVFLQLLKSIHLGTDAETAALVVWNISWPAIIVRARLVTIGKVYEEAAADLGANRLSTLRRVMLPLLAPMSEVAGRMAPQVGAHTLQRDGGGRGVLMGGVSGVYAAKVVVLGAGVSGMNAAAIALGMQAEVLLLDKNVGKLRSADAIYQGHLQTVASNAYEVERAVIDADLVIGAVLVPGAKAPKLVSNELVSRMKPGSVLVDISIDQGGCFEDSHPTTHDNPTYEVDGVVHYCVANMPGAVPHTSTHALTNATLPYVLALAEHGVDGALEHDPGLRMGLNVRAGEITYRAVAEALGV